MVLDTLNLDAADGVRETMLNLRSALILTAFALTVAAQADVLATFDFNDALNPSNGTPSAANTAALFDVDAVGGNVDAANTYLSSNFADANITNFNGTTLNGNGATSGQALALVSGGTGSTGNGNFVSANNGKYFQLQITATDGYLLDLSDLTFAVQRTGTGFTTEAFSYSFTGAEGTFTDLSTVSGIQSSFTAAGATATTVDLSGIDPATTVYLRAILDGASSTSGNNRIDNLVVNGTTLVAPSAVPEPASMTALGLGALAMLRRRRKG